MPRAGALRHMDFFVSARSGNGAKFVLEPVCVSVPGRICLAGEKLDWTGGEPIACAVDELRVYVLVSDRYKESTTSVRSYSPFHVSDEFTAGTARQFRKRPLDLVRAAFCGALVVSCNNFGSYRSYQYVPGPGAFRRSGVSISIRGRGAVHSHGMWPDGSVHVRPGGIAAFGLRA